MKWSVISLKLITKELEKLFEKYPIGSQDGLGGNAKVIVKFFNPMGVGTWLITEGNKLENGDYILVKKQDTAMNGEIVVALIEDEATVKTFYKEKDHIRLQPENSTMDPIIVPDCKILGKVAGVFRKM